MEKEKISIIVPIYNVENYLSRCLESIINQTYKNLEIILINDGSTDSSSEICNKYSIIDSRIKVIHKKNAGASVARNLGIKIATGDYIAFIDSDDYVELNMYETLYNNLINVDADVSVCGRCVDYFMDDNNSLSIKSNNRSKKIIMSNIDSLIAMNSLKMFDMSVCDKLYKTSLFNNIRFPNVGKCEDFYVMYQLLYKSLKVIYDSKKLYHYCKRLGSRSNSIVDDSYIIASKAQILFFENNCPEIIYIARCYYAYANTIYFNSCILSGLSDDKLAERRQDVKQNIKYVLKNKYFPLIRKIQIIVFAYIPFVYKAIILMKHRREVI